MCNLDIQLAMTILCSMEYFVVNKALVKTFKSSQTKIEFPVNFRVTTVISSLRFNLFFLLLGTILVHNMELIKKGENQKNHLSQTLVHA